MLVSIIDPQLDRGSATNQIPVWNETTKRYGGSSTLAGLTLTSPVISGNTSWTGTSTLTMSDDSKTLSIINAAGDALVIQDSANTILQVDTGSGFENIYLGSGPAKITFGYVTGNIDAACYKVSGTQVVGSQQAFISAPSGGGTVDVQARVSISNILNLLLTHGLMASS